MYIYIKIAILTLFNPNWRRSSSGCCLPLLSRAFKTCQLIPLKQLCIFTLKLNNKHRCICWNINKQKNDVLYIIYHIDLYYVSNSLYVLYSQIHLFLLFNFNVKIQSYFKGNSCQVLKALGSIGKRHPEDITVNLCLNETDVDASSVLVFKSS